ncbi:MAG: lantibiotic dehydratase [Mucilaginibacter sp.]|uniref:lantibiotic dehydratase n=1 Tax=Mucilaginibacter sp. TaxID=1882438 RepID=UPI003266013D
MSTHHFHSTLLLRTPVYSYSENNLTEVLKQSFFRKAIYFSSEVFYNELEKANFDLDKLDKKAVETLKKYFNRMCFRPTPFGICSAFGSLLWGLDTTDIKLSNNNLKPHIQFSYAKSIEYAGTLLNKGTDGLLYKLSAAIYKAGNEYRFIRSNYDNTQTEFIIDSFKGDRFFEKMLQYLDAWHMLPQIAEFVCQQTDCTDNEANTYIQWLIDKQIISQHLEANITGQDYLKRVLYERPDQSVKHIFDRVTQIHTAADLDKLPGKEVSLQSNDFYVNLGVNLPNAKLAQRYQQDIIDGLHCIDLLTPIAEFAGLLEFKKSFLQKFDGRTIPLLLALDPEVGVGYGNLAVEEDDVNIAKNIANASVLESRPLPWGNVHTLLFNKWKTAGKPNSALVLTDEDLKVLKKDDASRPNSMSVMFRVVDDKVFIESAGGPCASALIGRFTPFDQAIKQLANDMAANEVLHNPEVVFAEIVHICHDKTANIDRREHIYSYEIPVLTQSTMPAEQQILLSDLWVSVVNGKIILQSKKHGKRVIPRLSSAFNYTRNDLAVFRFLCDLQKADIKSNFGINLSQYFPGLNYYPRVEYKNTILQLAYWNIKKDIFKAVFKADVSSKVTLFEEIRIELQLPAYIALTQADHQLVFDLDSEPDILFFLDTIKSLQQITIKEYLLPSIAYPVVVNEYGQPQVNQFIASIYHTQQVYRPLTSPITEEKVDNRKFIPGSEWLYLKLYCHSIRSNELLADVIGGALKKLKKSNLVNEWFFIRYVDPGYHIRLRLKVEPQQHQKVLNILNTSLNTYVNTGLVSNYIIDTYERELERYSISYMAHFENVFYASSNFILTFLKQHSGIVNAKQILEFAMISVNDMLLALGLEGKSLVAFLEHVFTSFSNEFSSIGDLKYQLDTEFRKQKTVIEWVRKNDVAYYQDRNLIKARKLFIQSLSHLKQATSAKSKWKDKWISDLVHMHLNRLFVTDSRKQEMMVYYFMLKYERSVQARQTCTIP